MNLESNFNLTNLDFSGFDLVISEVVGNVLDDVKADAQQEAAYDTGELHDSIEKNFIEGAHEGSVTVTAGHWYFVEYGTGPHEITIRTKKVLADGTTVFGKRAFHPGTRAQPFLRPALFKSRTLRHKYGR